MIVVTSPTGHIGAALVALLLARNETVRVIARDPAKLDPHVRDRVEVVVGSHGDPATVMNAVSGADRVFWLIPPNNHAQDATTYYLNFTRPAARALVEQGVRQLVWVTTLGEQGERPAGQLTAALEADQMLRATGIHGRALQMPFFMENLLSQAHTIGGEGVFSLLNDANTPLLTVATADIAERAADLLADPTWTGQANVPVVGPDQLTPNAMAEVISEVLGRTVRFQQGEAQPFVSMLTGYGMSQPWAQGLVQMAEAQNEGFYGSPPQTAPTSFRQWCTTVLRSQLSGATAE